MPAEYISFDTVLEKHGLDKVGPHEPCIPVENFVKADQIILPKIISRLKEGGAVLLDGNFYHREHIEHLIKCVPYDHYVFTLKAPVEVCIERDAQREKPYGVDAVCVVHKLVSAFDYGITIDATRPFDAVVKEIASHLPSSLRT